ncbi:MAG: histone deacetylase [Candidatus Omnitrophica bacterium]|nr:histone deacetylase [Candidatus Omnitrophota bacterium]
MTTGFLYDPCYSEHRPSQGHPERPQRLSAVIEHLGTMPWFKNLKTMTSRIAEDEWIQAVHSPQYIRRAEEACKEGAFCLDSMDVEISRESFDVAKRAAGGALALADELMAGKITNGFGLLRPPGHHAEYNTAMGFCIFNNIAILARYLKKNHLLDKILILDWDVHHGNGTQHTFEEDPSVLYVSLHQYPFYPGTGAATETGIGRGRGATLNCPMSAGSGDREYEAAFQQTILPKIRRFKPEAVLVSAGFDAHRNDPLADMCLSTHFFGWMTERTMEVASEYCEGRLLSLLEGGYHLKTLSECVALHLKILSKQ